MTVMHGLLPKKLNKKIAAGGAAVISLIAVALPLGAASADSMWSGDGHTTSSNSWNNNWNNSWGNNWGNSRNNNWWNWNHRFSNMHWVWDSHRHCWVLIGFNVFHQRWEDCNTGNGFDDWDD